MHEGQRKGQVLAEQMSPVIDIGRGRSARATQPAWPAISCGQLMLANENARSALNDRLGIRGEILGRAAPNP